MKFESTPLKDVTELKTNVVENEEKVVSCSKETDIDAFREWMVANCSRQVSLDNTNKI